MESDFLLTDREQALIGRLVQWLYYPDSAPLGDVVRELEREPLNSQQKIFESVVSAVSFHQREREDFIVSQLGQKVERAELESTARKIINSEIMTDAETQKQANIYLGVALSLEKLYAAMLEKFNVRPFWGLISSIPPDHLNQLIILINKYFEQVRALGADSLFSDVPLPESLKAIFGKGPLMIIMQQLNGTAERLRFLKVILTIATAIKTNRESASPLADEEAQNLVAQLMYIQNTPVRFEPGW